jgi:hypothetical protein
MGHGRTRINGSARIRKEKGTTTKDTKNTKDGEELSRGDAKDSGPVAWRRVFPSLILFFVYFVSFVVGSFLSDPC